MKIFKKILLVSSLVALFSGTFIGTVKYVESNDSNIIEENQPSKIKPLTNKQEANKNNTITKEISNDETLDTLINESDNKKETVALENNNINKNDNFIFIGDSRTVGMSKVVDISDYEFVTFIAKSSEGFNWFSTTGLDKLEKRLTTTDLNYNIIFNLGVNDLHNVNKYAELYNSLNEKYPQHNFFVASVNPEDEIKMKSHGYKYVGNQYIEEFNNMLRENLNEDIIFIDSYEYLQKNGFDTKDGLHYTDEYSKIILDYISNQIKSIQ